jgi:hypothetical protein
MKTLKKAGLGLLILIVALAAVGFLLPRQVHVERSLAMKAPPAAIFTQINTLRNWPQWSPWHSLDPQMKLVYTGPAEGAGAAYSWTSDNSNVGNGTLTITGSQPFDRIDTSMDFQENGQATSTYLLRPTAGGTQVTWTMDSDMGANPAARYIGLMMDNMVGSDFEKGLASLKKIVEAPAVAQP